MVLTKSTICLQKSLFLLIIYFLISAFTNNLVNCQQLKWVFEMFRHGARSPLSLDKNNNDIFNNNWSGKGELTPVGMRQHYLVGYRNSKIYAKRLNVTRYSVDQIKISSTNTNRTIMSAYSHLQGFLPPSTGWQLIPEQEIKVFPPITYDFKEELGFLKNNSLKYQSNVFPIHIINIKDHDFYLEYVTNCEGVKNKVDNNKMTNEKYLNFSKYVINNYGKKILKAINKTEAKFNLSRYENIHNLFDSFMCGYTDGRKFTQLENFIDKNTMLKLAYEFYFIQLFELYSDNYIAHMSMSPLFNKILNNLSDRVNFDINNITTYTSKNPKISMISGHDINISGFLIFLRVVFSNKNIEINIPSYAGSVYIELIYDEKISTKIPEDKYFVNVLLNEDNIFNESIKYSDFTSTIKRSLIGNAEIQRFCNFTIDNLEENYDGLFIWVKIFAFLNAGLFIWFLFIFVKIKNADQSIDHYLKTSDYDRELCTEMKKLYVK